MSVPYGDIARLMQTAAQLEALEFYNFTFEHKLPPKLNIRTMPDDGMKMQSLSERECEVLAADLNAAIKPVLTRWADGQVDKARELIRLKIPPGPGGKGGTA